MTQTWCYPKLKSIKMSRLTTLETNRVHTHLDAYDHASSIQKGPSDRTFYLCCLSWIFLLKGSFSSLVFVFVSPSASRIFLDWTLASFFRHCLWISFSIHIVQHNFYLMAIFKASKYVAKTCSLTITFLARLT